MVLDGSAEKVKDGLDFVRVNVVEKVGCAVFWLFTSRDSIEEVHANRLDVTKRPVVSSRALFMVSVLLASEETGVKFRNSASEVEAGVLNNLLVLGSADLIKVLQVNVRRWSDRTRLGLVFVKLVDFVQVERF